MFVTKAAKPLLSFLVLPSLYRHVSGKEGAWGLPQILPFSTKPAEAKPGLRMGGPEPRSQPRARAARAMLQPQPLPSAPRLLQHRLIL